MTAMLASKSCCRALEGINNRGTNIVGRVKAADASCSSYRNSKLVQGHRRMLLVPAASAASLRLRSSSKSSSFVQRQSIISPHTNGSSSSSCGRRRQLSIVCRAGGDGNKSPGSSSEISQEARIRGEVIAPFRTLRMFLYIAFMASGTLGGLVALSGLIASLAGAPNAAPVETIAKDLAIDVAAVVVFALLYRSDAKARDLSLARLAREESLSRLRMELSNGRIVSIEQLRGTCRLVIVVGPANHVQEAIRRAEPVKKNLLDRGVLVVPFITEGATGGSFASFSEQFKTVGGGKISEDGGAATESSNPVAVEAAAEITRDMEARWLARPLYANEWQRWLDEQRNLANVVANSPVYLSLRLDGRVRGSGVGFPPWQVIAAQLPPMKGMWAGPLDGMDGRVL